MTNCPACGNLVEGDFGLVNCSQCGAMVMIEMGGGDAAPALTESVPPEIPQESIAKTVNTEEWSDDQLEIPAEVPPVPPSMNDLRDIADFGNRETSEVNEGSLRYNLFISGVDTAEIRQNFIEVIEDKKFLLDTSAIISNIQGGEVSIAEITPIKCAVLVQRLKSLPIQIRWEQYATLQS